jgi:pyruvate dehydrogenase E2 component (dihydrolipoamide acetyltransferase)
LEIAASPFAKMLAAERGLDLTAMKPAEGAEIRAADVLRKATETVRITPLAKRLAQSRGLDVKGVLGSGHRGKIRSADISGIPSPEIRPESGDADFREVLPMTSMRRGIARRMEKSTREIPAVTQYVEADVTELIQLRLRINEGRSKTTKLSMNAFVLRAVAIAVKEHERFRMQLAERDSYLLHSDVNVGFAVGMGELLLVPVIRRADELSAEEIGTAVGELARKAREGILKREEYGCGVITVSNMGMYGVLAFTPIINQPEASILGVGVPVERLVLTENGIQSRRMMTLSLTYDHRIINGTEAALFERHVKELLETPQLL